MLENAISQNEELKPVEETSPESEQKPTLNAFEQKRVNKAERLRERAERAKREGESRFAAAKSSVAGIPFGQPILVGHHSEGRHRAAINRHDTNMRKGCEAYDKADYYAQRAAAIESSRAIFSDDPDATEKLADKISRLEERQKRMKDINDRVRKLKVTKGDEASLEKLREALDESELTALLQACKYQTQIKFPAYLLTNNNANIRRLKQRLEQLQKAAESETTETELPGGVKIVDNVEANRVQIFFPSIPSTLVRTTLKSCAFKWSRTEGAWQRHRSDWAMDRAKHIAARFAAEGETQ